jgi:hypothetical protein
MEDLGSPIGAFIREHCDIGPECLVLPQTLFETWGQWCKDTGREHAGTVQAFGRDLRAFLPAVKVVQPRELGQQVRYYESLQLKRVKRDSLCCSSLFLFSSLSRVQESRHALHCVSVRFTLGLPRSSYTSNGSP